MTGMTGMTGIRGDARIYPGNFRCPELEGILEERAVGWLSPGKPHTLAHPRFLFSPVQ
jgi:hypothetical protein